MPHVRRWLLTLVFSLVSSSLLWGQADLRILVGSATVPEPSTGNTFEVSITNAGSVPSAPLAAFSFGLSVPGASGITFTNATITTVLNPYLFLGQSSTPPFSNTAFPNQSFIATDLYAAAGGIIIAPGQTCGLGLITFDAAAGAINTAVTLAPFPSTSLSDDLANNVTFTGFDGIITIAAVPEPTTWALMGIAVCSIASLGYRRFQQKKATQELSLRSAGKK